MNLLQKVKDFFSAPSYTRTLALIGILVLVLALPVTVAFLGQQTNTQQHASVSGGGDGGGSTCYAVGHTCGFNSDCCGGGSTTYCSKKGTCTKYCTPSTGTQCNGDYLCTATYNYNKVCGSTQLSNCQHIANSCGYVPPTAPPACSTLGDGYGCFYGGCPPNSHPPTDGKSYTCGTSGNQQCCTKPLDCGAANSTTAGASCQTKTSSGDCPSGYEYRAGGTCADSGKTCCMQKIQCTGTAGTCVGSSYDYGFTTCKNNDYKTPSTCTDGGKSGVCCNNSSVVQPTFDGCGDFDARGTTPETDAGCQAAAKSGVPTAARDCKYPQYYIKIQVPTSEFSSGFACHFNSPVAPSCSDGKSLGKCYVNNSCGGGMSEINPTSKSCPTGYRICCASGATTSITPPPGTQYSCVTDFGTAPGKNQLANYNNGKPTALNKYCASDSYCHVTNGSQPYATNDTDQICHKGTPTCANQNGKCTATHNDCGTFGDYTRALGLDATCGGSGSNEICCIPKPKTTPPPGGCGSNCSNGPTCTNGKTTSFVLSLKLEGIGAGNFENNSPAHPTRQAVYVKVTDGSGTVLYNNTTTQFTYSNGVFTAPSVSLGTSLVCGKTYTVSVKIPLYLPANGTVEYSTNKTINLNPIAGDINAINPTTNVNVGDGKIDVNDYALVAGCRNADATAPLNLNAGSSPITTTCGNLMNFIDYADGGTTDDEWSFNYNLWLRGFIKANGY